MRAKLFLCLFVLLPVIGSAQDSVPTSAKTTAVLDRFRSITGPDANYADSMAAIRRRLDSEIDRNRQLSDSIADLQALLLLSEKKGLVRHYGAGQLRPYNEQQYRDFEENRFLQQYFAAEQGAQVFFGFNEVTANLRLNTELNALAEQWKQQPQSRIVITASSDATGDEHTNLELARQRAEHVKAYLVSVLGVDSAQIDIATAGSGTAEKITDPELDFLNRRAVVRMRN